MATTTTLQNIYKVTKEQYESIIAGTFEGHTYDENALYLVEDDGQIDLSSCLQVTRLEANVSERDALNEIIEKYRGKSGYYLAEYNDNYGDEKAPLLILYSADPDLIEENVVLLHPQGDVNLYNFNAETLGWDEKGSLSSAYVSAQTAIQELSLENNEIKYWNWEDGWQSWQSTGIIIPTKTSLGLDKVNNVAITDDQVTQIGTNKSDIDTLKTKVSNLTGAFQFQGSLDDNEDLPAATADNKGYVYIKGHKEYVSDGTQWIELGDEGSFVLKTTYESHLNEQKAKDEAQDKAIAAIKVPTTVAELSDSGEYAKTGQLFSGNYNDLTNKPTIPTMVTQLEDGKFYAKTSDLPKNTSDLTNDSGFITSEALPTTTSQLTNDSGFITIGDVPAAPTSTSQLTNDSGFITSAEVPTKTSDLTNDSGFVTATDHDHDAKYLPITEDVKVSDGKVVFDKIYARTSSSGTEYGMGTSAYVLKSNGTNVYWGSDANSTSTLSVSSIFKAKNPYGGYQILFTDRDNLLVPAVSGSGTNTGTSKVMNTEPFNPFGPILYTSSASNRVVDQTCSNSTHMVYADVNVSYSFNCGSTLTANKPFYVVAKMQEDGMAVLHSPYYSQTLPTSEDGLIYIYLGQTSGANLVYLYQEHPIYVYKSGKICQFLESEDLSNKLSVIDLGTTNIDDALLKITSDYSTQSGYYVTNDDEISSDCQALINYCYEDETSSYALIYKYDNIVRMEYDGTEWLMTMNLSSAFSNSREAFKSASISGNTLTFTKNNNTTTSVTLPSGMSTEDKATLDKLNADVYGVINAEYTPEIGMSLEGKTIIFHEDVLDEIPFESDAYTMLVAPSGSGVGIYSYYATDSGQKFVYAMQVYGSPAYPVAYFVNEGEWVSREYTWTQPTIMGNVYSEASDLFKIVELTPSIIPTKVSQLTNDSNFVDQSSIDGVFDYIYEIENNYLKTTDLGTFTNGTTLGVLNNITASYKTKSGTYKAILSNYGHDDVLYIDYFYNDNSNNAFREYANAIIHSIGSSNRTYYYTWENLGTADGNFTWKLNSDSGTVASQAATAFKDASVSGNTLTFTKNDGTTKDVILPTTGSVTAETELMAKVTYKELVELRNSGSLIPGQQYRIIDYNCSTIQPSTICANHPFDIIVTADSYNSLNENARACNRDGDDYFNKITTETSIISATFKDGVTIDDIEIFYRINIDVGSEYTPDGIDDGKGDSLVELNYAENNKGQVVPVLYKNANEYIETGEEGPDYGDTFFYVGQEILDGITYDKWRKIEASGFSWEDSSQVYILTNIIVDAELGEEIITSKISSNLESWELKYSLDNDESRFKWACDGKRIYTDDGLWFKFTGMFDFEDSTYFKWEHPEFDGCLLSTVLYVEAYSELDYLDLEGSLHPGYSTVQCLTDTSFYTQEGKGVIYYMKDNHNNICGYDFKNILFYNENDYRYFYTFNSSDNNETDLSIKFGKESCYNNQIEPCKDSGLYSLNHNIFYGDYFFNNYLDFGSRNNIFCDTTFNNTTGKNFIHNYVHSNIWNNTFGNDISYCEFDEYIQNQTFKSGLSGEYFDESYEGPTANSNSNALPELNNPWNLESRVNHQKRVLNCQDLITVDLSANWSWLQDCQGYELRLGSSLRYLNLPGRYTSNSFPIKYYGSIEDWCKIKISNTSYSSPIRSVEFELNPADGGRKVITIPEYYTTIQPYLFKNFQYVEHVKLHKNITTIGQYAFDLYPSKPSAFILTYNGTVEDWCKIEFQDYRSNPMRFATSITFDNISWPQQSSIITIPDSITSLNSYTFDLCNIKATLQLPRTLTTIDGDAITGNNALDTPNHIYIPNTVINIQNNGIDNFRYALCEVDSKPSTWWDRAVSAAHIYWGVKDYEFFSYNTESDRSPYRCLHINSETMNDSIIVETPYGISSDAHFDFADFRSGIPYDGELYTKIRIQNHDASLNKEDTINSSNSIINQSLISTNIPSSIELLPASFFVNCQGLKTVVIEPGITDLSNSMFKNCISLESVSLPNTIVSLCGHGIFENCSSLKALDLPESLKVLGYSAYFYESGIEELNLKNVEQVGAGSVTVGMNSLKRLIMPKVKETGNSFTIDGCINLEYFEAGELIKLHWAYNPMPNLKTLIIRTPDQVCELVNNYLTTDTHPLVNIYVPDNLVDQYKIATNWISVADRIKPLSEFIPAGGTND